MSDYNNPRLGKMSAFIEKTIDKKGTALVHKHIHGTPAPRLPETGDLPKRKGYPAAGDQGKGVNYTPRSEAGHKV